ncbi:gamma-glutamylcyclotransferase [Actimicrobium sp. CCC2.4]|uniref:gamma-glutamylcyclotransferase n=1 Tax=Actimicrobium sp. CCC2.4 TaxID=3048606 RepID=UPI002AC934E0|nr:gamma-glutamylcyclotransferase [Actimicrobium sp. CCC2.4]MEB0134817.1 gamma-glutamylcyclotransferase [Actimicrobium sp. CCC2.4]WPX30755.1 gamma-glutamylcyclotransferase [Actimicrobium sp. CCC2.4]
MDIDTTAINQQRHRFGEHEQVWLFGYGSLIFKADFPYLERKPATIRGHVRRFWQGSHDHRGTPGFPGRVVTLTPQSDATCAGMAYLIRPDVFNYLDHREKNGYLRFSTTLAFDDGSQAQGLVYIADPDNAAYLGPATDREIARQIAAATGPSGRNRDYLTELADALAALGTTDLHVQALVACLPPDSSTETTDITDSR